MHRNNVHAAKQGVVVGAGLPREAGDAVHGTGCAGARGCTTGDILYIVNRGHGLHI
jgi:hypothetical protein